MRRVDDQRGLRPVGRRRAEVEAVRRVAQHVTRSDLTQSGARFFVDPIRLDGAEIDFVAEVVFSPPISFLRVLGELEQRGKTAARL